MKNLTIIFALFVTFLIFNNSFSQITGNIQAKGTVLTPINIASTRDLDFGNDILPGIDRTIDKSASTSGKFSLTGQASKQINITFTLPANLTYNSNTLPIIFSSTDAGTQVTSGSIVAFNPATATNSNFGTDGKLDVLLGGKVTPSHTQEAGAYTATVSVSLYYTGN